MTLATPLAFVVLVGAENDPPVPDLLHVTSLPDVCTGLPPLSANCAVIVIGAPAVGLLLLEVTTYLAAGPGLKVARTVIALLFIPNAQVPLRFPQPAEGLDGVPMVKAQPAKVDGAVGVSVSVTASVCPKLLSLQVPGGLSLAAPAESTQLIFPPPPLLITVPLPVAAKVTVRFLLSQNVVCA